MPAPFAIGFAICESFQNSFIKNNGKKNMVLILTHLGSVEFHLYKNKSDLNVSNTFLDKQFQSINFAM